MKKITVFAAVVIAAVACSPKELEPAAPVQTMTLRASVADDATKTVLIDNGDKTYNVNWEAGDAINVNGEESTNIDIDGTDPRVAVFTLPVVSAPYVSVYPSMVYSHDYTAAEGDTPASMKINLPLIQNYTAGSFDSNAAVLLGKGNSSLTFNHAMAYLKVTVNGTVDTDDIKSIRVQANDGVPMSGVFTATFGDTPSLGSGEDSFSTVTLDCGSGFPQGLAMYIAIPAQTYPHGINLLIVDANNHYMTRRSTASFSAVAGKVYPTTVSFEPEGTYVQGGIYSLADWGAFAAAVTGGDDYLGETVTLMKDLSVDTFFEYANGTFNGTFDGNNHTLTANGNKWPLFAVIGGDGTVKDLTVGGSFASIANQGVAGNAVIAKQNLGTIDNVTNTSETNLTITSPGLVFGTIVCQNGGLLKDCVNEGDITLVVTTNNSSGLYGGGIAAAGHTLLEGMSGSGPVDVDETCVAGVFNGCINRGNIHITDVSGALPIKAAFGGICGVAFKDGVSFTGCSNEGVVSKIDNGVGASNTASCLGGICGRAGATNDATSLAINASTGYEISFSGCSNTGKLEHLSRVNNANFNASKLSSETGARKVYTGGIAGLAVGKSSAKPLTITSCTSTGEIGTGWNGVSSNVPGGLVGCATNVTVTNCSVAASIYSSTAASGSSANRYVAVFGGVAGLSLGNLVVSGGQYWIDADVTYGSDSWPGLLIGLSIKSGTSFSNVEVGGTITRKGTAESITSANYSSWLYSSSSPSAPTVTGSSWLTSKPIL